MNDKHAVCGGQWVVRRKKNYFRQIKINNKHFDWVIDHLPFSGLILK
jgi:hypothetical protein